MAAANPKSNSFSVNIPGSPQAMAVNTLNTEAYVLYDNSHNSGTERTMDLTSGKVLGTIPIRANLTDLALDPERSQLYLTSACDSPCNGSVHVVDTETDQVVDTIDVGSGASTGALSPDGRFAFVTNDGELCVINTADEN